MSAHEITVIDYGVGNLLSVQRSLEYCGARVIITADERTILRAKKVVLPGVGAFSNAMKTLNNLGLTSIIQEVAERNIPLLGICLGMQLLLDGSDEFGYTEGLGLISGRVVPVPNKTLQGEIQKIPHIGWSELQVAGSTQDWGKTLLKDIKLGDSVYFVHSFMAIPEAPAQLIADCQYGGHRIPAVIAKDHIVGCQFHPEKSGEVGLKILRRFCFD